MPRIVWDGTGERFFETGTDRGVLYLRDENGAYTQGYAWNGLTGVTESPTGAEPTPLYADNIKYLNLMSAEDFACTIEAFTYPEAFAACDGTAQIKPGLYIAQQDRKVFGFSYRTLIGNDVDGNAHGYKIHLVYGGLASPSEKANATVNDTPEATAMSWEVSTTPVAVAPVGGVSFKPTAHLVISSLEVSSSDMEAIEAVLYGGESAEPTLPLPDAVAALITAG